MVSWCWYGTVLNCLLMIEFQGWKCYNELFENSDFSITIESLRLKQSLNDRKHPLNVTAAMGSVLQKVLLCCISGYGGKSIQGK